MIGTSVMKELTTLNNKFYRIRKEEREQSHVHVTFDLTWMHFNIYEYLKWLEKLIWLINIKFYVIVTDIFHKYKIRSLKVFL